MDLDYAIDEIKNKQLNVGEILSFSWRIFTNNIKPLMIVALIVYLPLLIIQILIPYDTILTEYGENGIKVVELILKFMNIFIRVIGLVAIILIASNDVEGIKYSYDQALRKSISLWGKIIGTSFHAGLIVLGFTLLLIIPGIIRSVQYLFILYVVIFRNISGKSALDYSKSLVEGQWWRIFGINLFIQLLAYLLGIILALSFLIIPIAFISELIIYSLGEIIDVFFTIALTVFFLNTDYLKLIVQENEKGQAEDLLDESLVTP